MEMARGRIAPGPLRAAARQPIAPQTVPPGIAPPRPTLRTVPPARTRQIERPPPIPVRGHPPALGHALRAPRVRQPRLQIEVEICPLPAIDPAPPAQHKLARPPVAQVHPAVLSAGAMLLPRAVLVPADQAVEVSAAVVAAEPAAVVVAAVEEGAAKSRQSS